MIVTNQNEFTTGPLTLEEMLKITSLFENPPEANGVRRALRFYEIPKHLRESKYKWGTIDEMRKVMEHFANPQHPDELEWMLQFVRGKTTLLEIGSSFGGTLRKMASVMPKGSKIVSVDLPVDDTPAFLNPKESLQEACRQIGILGASVDLFVGDSHSKTVVEAVSSFAPFDFCFIDGDHTYEGVKEDWENYGPMAYVVGFHDIAGLESCRRLWKEIKESGEYRTDEFVAPGGAFGIGVVFREE